MPEPELNRERLAFTIFKHISGYEEQLAREEWTGKHYQNKNKENACKIADALIHAEESILEVKG